MFASDGFSILIDVPEFSFVRKFYLKSLITFSTCCTSTCMDSVLTISSYTAIHTHAGVRIRSVGWAHMITHDIICDKVVHNEIHAVVIER